LYMTNRRLLFHAGKGDARWLIVPYGEVKSTGIYAAPTATMGAPGVRAHCLFIETTKGEHVWWDFHDDEERAWLPIVQERASAATADEAEDYSRPVLPRCAASTAPACSRNRLAASRSASSASMSWDRASETSPKSSSPSVSASSRSLRLSASTARGT